MTTSAMPPGRALAVQEALEEIGYSQFALDYEFDADFTVTADPNTASLVAFWQEEPRDQFTSAIAVHWIPDARAEEPYLKAAGQKLWAPYAILARQDRCALWETLALATTASASGEPFRLLEENIAYPDLLSALRQRSVEIEPEAIAERKRQWRQMALYETSPEPNAFIEWAYRPTRDRLIKVFGKLLDSAREGLAPEQQFEAEHLRWLLRMVGVRIAWDKRWLEPGNRTSAEEIRLAALRYPTDLRSKPELPPPATIILAELVADQLGSVHLGAAEGGLLSQIIQDNGLPRSVRQEWKLYPTPPEIAWRMLAGLPVEILPEGDRRVWDGTAGTGTILVAALDRLRQLRPGPRGPELRDYLVGALAGNDRAALLADTTRIALDLALGAPAGPEWWITTDDVQQARPRFGNKPPTIIVSNPPFGGVGRSPDLAIPILGRYLDQLSSGALLSVVVPRSLLASRAAQSLRQRLLKELDLFEIWTLPGGTFQGTDVEAAVLSGQKRYRQSSTLTAVTWRDSSGRKPTEIAGAVRQDDWLSFPSQAIVPPLALRLHTALSACPMLASYVPKNRRTQGITPGKSGRDEVIETAEPGAKPYLAGRTGMLPFYVPWRERPRWIRYPSPRLQWPRPSYAALFRSPKVIVSRQATWGSAWRVRAAVDRDELLPSNLFIVLAPEKPLSAEFLAGLLNSAFANAWLGIMNPAFTVRIDDLLHIPVPADLNYKLLQDIEGIAHALAALRGQLAHLPNGRFVIEHPLYQEAATLTLQLDVAVYDLYGLPHDLRYEISRYFVLAGSQRPGFSEPIVGRPPAEASPPHTAFGDEENRRMNALFSERAERGLSSDEQRELDALVASWQHAYRIDASKAVEAQRQARLHDAANPASQR